MKTWARRLSLGLLAVGLVVWLSGCLGAKYSALVRYDEAKDEFTILNVYQGITAGTPQDSEYLYQLWRNRDHLIRVPNLDIFGVPAFLRLSRTQYAPVNLGQAPPGLDPADTPLPLDQIRILPGTFFLHGPDTLCYYDQVVIPGKVIDQALQLIRNASVASLTEKIDAEVQRRKEGGKTVEWPKLRLDAVESVHSSLSPTTEPTTGPATTPAEPEAKTEPLQVLDDESLQLLRKGVSDGAMKFTREKQVFRFILPLSDADARQLEQTWHAALDAVKSDAAKATAETSSRAAIASKIMPAFMLSTHPHAIELKVDLAILINHLPELYGITDPLSDPTPETRKYMHDTVTALRAHGAPIDEKLTIEQLAKEFATDSVKSYPSDHPVEPGTGMVQAPPVKK